MKPLRWGIIGPGKIARKFADALERVEGNTLQAVASRDPARADEFVRMFRAERAYDRYEKLATDPEIDVVYVATPHAFHKDHTLLCLRNGKPVLCEKPLAVNVAAVQQMIAASRASDTFLMEAFWTRFMPHIRKLEQMIREKVIGEIKYIQADFGVKFDYNPASRIFDLNLGGGSMLDVGVYPLFLVLLLLGKPDTVQSSVHKSPTGSDELTNAIFSYGNGALASILSATNCKTPLTADIIGTTGMIHIPAAWWKGQHFVLTKGDSVTRVEAGYPGNGYEFEIDEVQRCLHLGKKESDLLPLSFSLQMSEIAEAILAPHGIVYS